MKTVKERLTADLLSGKIDKWTYIDQMYSQHKVLFEYAKGMADTNICQIEITDGHVIMTTRDNGIRLEAGEYDQRCAPIEMLNFSGYEEEEWNIMIKILKEAQIHSFVDVGANIGYISLLLEKQIPDIQVIAFEPIEKTYEIFKRNIALNHAGIHAVHKGLSNEEGVMTYYYYPEGSGNASLRDLSGRQDVQKIKTQVTTLDQYMKKHDIKAMDFIKIDVEGAEFDVIRGGAESIKKFRPIMYVELLRKWSAPFGYKPDDVIKWMAERDYGCYVVKAGKVAEIDKIDEETKETNFIFLHKENHNGIIEKFSL